MVLGIPHGTSAARYLRAVPWQELQVTICGSIFKLLLSSQGCVCCMLYCTLQGTVQAT